MYPRHTQWQILKFIVFASADKIYNWKIIGNLCSSFAKRCCVFVWDGWKWETTIGKIIVIIMWECMAANFITPWCIFAIGCRVIFYLYCFFFRVDIIFAVAGVTFCRSIIYGCFVSTLNLCRIRSKDHNSGISVYLFQPLDSNFWASLNYCTG
jgi:hypothetical protein